MMTSAYRPRNPGHDYHGRGTYLITLVVSGREQLLSFFSAMGIDALNEETADYASERQQWKRAILEGCTVIVTPGISGGERLMKNECMKQGFPLIHLQKEPIGAFWKPERQRFEACANGSLLILAPWDLDTMGSVGSVPSDTDYSRFHNLNTLAAEICAFDGDARILG